MFFLSLSGPVALQSTNQTLLADFALASGETAPFHSFIHSSHYQLFFSALVVVVLSPTFIANTCSDTNGFCRLLPQVLLLFSQPTRPFLPILLSRVAEPSPSFRERM